MFNSTVLEVAIGLVFCYCAVSLIVSSLNEAISSVLGLRAATLLSGVKALLNDQQFQGLAREIYNHALVNPRDGGRAEKESDLTAKPSYIPSMQFADALIDVLQQAPAAANQLGQAIGTIQDPQIKQLLEGLYKKAAGNVDRFQSEVASWFDNGMSRVSGHYKRQTQLICFLLGLAIAGLLNIDSVHLFKTLWLNPALADGLTALPPQDATKAFDALQTLPIGWGVVSASFSTWDYLLMFGGWLVTASSALFGAPFWFDLLQNITQLRGTGRKPGSTTGTK